MFRETSHSLIQIALFNFTRVSSFFLYTYGFKVRLQGDCESSLKFLSKNYLSVGFKVHFLVSYRCSIFGVKVCFRITRTDCKVFLPETRSGLEISKKYIRKEVLIN